MQCEHELREREVSESESEKGGGALLPAGMMIEMAGRLIWDFLPILILLLSTHFTSF